MWLGSGEMDNFDKNERERGENFRSRSIAGRQYAPRSQVVYRFASACVILPPDEAHWPLYVCPMIRISWWTSMLATVRTIRGGKFILSRVRDLIVDRRPTSEIGA